MATEVGGQQATETETRTLSGPALAGLSGRLRLDVAGKPARVMEVRDGTMSIRPSSGAERADAVVWCDSEETLEAFNRGALNPVVGALQGRLGIAGDRALALRVVLALQAVIRPPPASAREAGTVKAE
jgi:putative sterol carrier protein